MTAVLVAACLTCGAGTDESTSHTIVNALQLTDNDWSSVRDTDIEVPVSRMRNGQFKFKRGFKRVFRTLSLRQGQRWDEGTVWLVHETVSDLPSQSPWLLAYKGTYRLALHATEDHVIVMHLGFMKRYSVAQMADGPLDWQLDQRFDPVGADLHLALGDDDRVPDDHLELSVERAYFVDASGKETTKRAAPNNLLQKVVGGPVRKLTNPGFVDIGETLRLERGDVMCEVIGQSPPPSFRSRAGQRLLTLSQDGELVEIGPNRR